MRGLLERYRALGDAEADALVARLAAQAGGAGNLDALLEGLLRWNVRIAPVPDFPPEMRAFLGARTPAPPWIDDARVLRAQTTFQRYRLAGLVMLACAGLPACYAQPDIAVTLAGSGKLLSQVRRRLRETVDFSTVMTPGSLAAGGAGLAWIRKVRLLHALMRALALERPPQVPVPTGDRLSDFLLALDWTGRRGPPINQVDLAFVLLTFSWLVVRGWQRLGARLGEAEKVDFIVTWAWIGQMLGVEGELLTVAPGRELAGAKALYEAIREASEAGTEEGGLLTAALAVIAAEQQRRALGMAVLPSLPPPLRAGVEWFLAAFPGWTNDIVISMPRTLIRKLAGRPMAARLWIGRAPFLHWLPGYLMNRAVHWGSTRLNDLRPMALGGVSRTRGVTPLLGLRFDRIVQSERRAAMRRAG